ncbi:DUF485 domain-containing protein [Streptomyces sp. NPDC048179]|uniref:DUF485 domain-containing protein n=1 Tax=Streptomyces sp. NPDC048179 TaxID=3365506 RepID=UPI00372233BB
MQSYFAPPPSTRQTAAHPAHEAEVLQLGESLRERAHQAQRALLAINGVPFAAGIVLSSFTKVPAIPVHGRLTLGLTWGVLQIGLFVATTWLYEARCTGSCDPLEHSLDSRIAGAEQSGAHPGDGFGW